MLHLKYQTGWGQVALVEAKWSDLEKSGFGSNFLNNYLIVEIWFGRRSSPHARPITGFCHLSLCSPGGCGVRPRLREQRQMGPWPQAPQLLGYPGDGVHCSLWHFKIILPESPLSLLCPTPKSPGASSYISMWSLTSEKCSGSSSYQTVMLDGWALGGTDLVMFWPWLFLDGLGWRMPLTLKGTHLEDGGGALCQAHNFPCW